MHNGGDLAYLNDLSKLEQRFSHLTSNIFKGVDDFEDELGSDNNEWQTFEPPFAV